MSDGSDSEERALPASEKKLREARRKGQISHSTDMVAGAGLSAMLLYLWLTLPDLVDRLQAVMARIEEVSLQPFAAAVVAIELLLRDVVMPYVGKALLVVVFVSLMINAVITKGFVFSLDPITPRAANLHPARGFKRIFGLKNLVELAKSVIKTALLVVVCVGVLRFGLNAIVQAPACGLGCLAPVLAAVVAPLLVAAILILVAGGLIDVALQRGLFLRQMRMTRTEMKRERRDQEGMPEIRSAQRHQRHALVQGGGRVGIESATVLIEGDDVVVGLRYVPGETQVPRLVCKGRSGRAQNLTESAVALNIPRFRDPDLATELDRRIVQDHYITEEFFKRVAVVLRSAGTV